MNKITKKAVISLCSRHELLMSFRSHKTIICLENISSVILFFQMLIPGQQFSWDVAKIPENKNKNRYGNIIACKLELFPYFAAEINPLYKPKSIKNTSHCRLTCTTLYSLPVEKETKMKARRAENVFSNNFSLSPPPPHSPLIGSPTPHLPLQCIRHRLPEIS